MKFTSWRCALVALVTSTGVFVAACGSSSHSSSSHGSITRASAGAGTATSNASTAAASPAGAPIKLGMICSCSGPQAGSEGLTGKTANAWAAWVNGHGGINGHPVHMTVIDDASNPAQSLQAAKKLVEADHVMAIVGEFSLADQSWAAYVAKQNIPVVGGISASFTFLTNPDFFPSGASLVADIVGTVAQANAAGKHHIGVAYCAEAPVCAQIIPLVKLTAQQLGMQASFAKISSTAPTYVPTCLQFKSAGDDALFVGDGSPIPERVTDGCAQQGYKPTTVNTTGTATAAWLKDANLDGTLLTGYQANAFDASTPAVAEFQQALEKAYPGITKSPGFDANLISVWSGGQLFAAAAKVAHVGPDSTGADVKHGLYALKNETIGGLNVPTTYVPGKPAFSPCYFTLKISGGKFVSSHANQPVCLPPALTAALAKGLHLG
jgi:branched-chain amino acid transport system substrate-binding protein